jgi:hypothetical protein
MSATITANNGAGTTTPHFITVPFETSWQSRNVVHDLIGGGLAVSLVEPRPRAGGLELLYLSEASAFAASALHQQESTFTLVESDRVYFTMTYVVDSIDGAADVKPTDGRVSLGALSVPYARATVVLPLTAATILDDLDPREDHRVFINGGNTGHWTPPSSGGYGYGGYGHGDYGH